MVALEEPRVYAIDGLREMLKRPGFWNARLEDIGAELGVTRERARQVIAKLGIEKPRHSPLAWLHSMPTDALLSAYQMAGGGRALDDKWHLKRGITGHELRRRGLKAPVVERPMSLAQLSIVDRKAFNVINTARCVAYYHAHIEERRAYAREYRRLHPEVQKRASAKWLEKKKADPVWVEAQRVKSREEYYRAKARKEA
jgi:hypothetical protein